MEQIRCNKIDVLKGLLIILVVMGHAEVKFVHDVVFLSHMPLFFIISGLLLKKERLMEGTKYIKNKIRNLMVPYFTYLIIDLFFVRRDYTTGSIIRVLWGGRAISGVYWYITCFLFTSLLLYVLIKTFSDKMSKVLIFMGGGIAVIELHLVNKIHLLQSPGIPWNLNVSLMALVCVGIGFFYKDKIKEMLESDLKRYDLLAGGITVSLA